MGKRRKSRHRPDPLFAFPAEHDERYPITGASPEAYLVRFAGGLADYDADERPQTVSVMRKVALGALLACALLVGFGFLLM